MNTWKERLIEYLQTIDGTMSLEESDELFYGRQYVYAVRWENEKAGTHGYAPKCKNEWDRNICGKSMPIKGACKKCAYRENQEITDASIKQHLAGNGRNAIVGLFKYS